MQQHDWSKGPKKYTRTRKLLQGQRRARVQHGRALYWTDGRNWCHTVSVSSAGHLHVVARIQIPIYDNKANWKNFDETFKL